MGSCTVRTLLVMKCCLVFGPSWRSPGVNSVVVGWILRNHPTRNTRRRGHRRASPCPRYSSDWMACRPRRRTRAHPRRLPCLAAGPDGLLRLCGRPILLRLLSLRRGGTWWLNRRNGRCLWLVGDDDGALLRLLGGWLGRFVLGGDLYQVALVVGLCRLLPRRIHGNGRTLVVLLLRFHGLILGGCRRLILRWFFRLILRLLRGFTLGDVYIFGVFMGRLLGWFLGFTLIRTAALVATLRGSLGLWPAGASLASGSF